MRTPLIAGNWKMNTNRAEAVALAKGIADGAQAGGADVLVCPPFVYLDAVAGAVQGLSLIHI